MIKKVLIFLILLVFYSCESENTLTNSIRIIPNESVNEIMDLFSIHNQIPYKIQIKNYDGTTFKINLMEYKHEILSAEINFVVDSEHFKIGQDLEIELAKLTIQSLHNEQNLVINYLGIMSGNNKSSISYNHEFENQNTYIITQKSINNLNNELILLLNKEYILFERESNILEDNTEIKTEKSKIVIKINT